MRVIHFTKTASKISQLYTTNQIFWVAINKEELPTYDPNRPIVVYHFESNCAVFDQTKMNGFCAALYPNNVQMNTCHSLNSFTPPFTKGKCGPQPRQQGATLRSRGATSSSRRSRGGRRRT